MIFPRDSGEYLVPQICCNIYIYTAYILAVASRYVVYGFVERKSTQQEKPTFSVLYIHKDLLKCIAIVTTLMSREVMEL